MCVCSVWGNAIWATCSSHVHMWCVLHFLHGFINVFSHIHTTRSTHNSVLCNMPDGRDQEIRHWGEHMCLAHYPSSSPSSTLHTRLHMLRTGGHFHTSGNLSHNGRHVSQSLLLLLLFWPLFLNFNKFALLINLMNVPYTYENYVFKYINVTV